MLFKCLDLINQYHISHPMYHWKTLYIQKEIRSEIHPEKFELFTKKDYALTLQDVCDIVNSGPFNSICIESKVVLACYPNISDYKEIFAKELNLIDNSIQVTQVKDSQSNYILSGLREGRGKDAKGLVCIEIEVGGFPVFLTHNQFTQNKLVFGLIEVLESIGFCIVNSEEFEEFIKEKSC